MSSTFSCTSITNIIFYYTRLFVTFFLFRTRPVLVIPEIRPFVTRFSHIGLNAIHEGWRVPAALVLVIVQFAKCTPPHPAARYIEIIVIIFFDFSHGKCARGKRIRLRCADVVRNCVSTSVKLARLLLVGCLVFSRSNESRGG